MGRAGDERGGERDAIDICEGGRACFHQEGRRERSYETVFGKSGIRDGGGRDGDLYSGRQSDREYQGFQNRDREGYGEPDYGVAEDEIILKFIVCPAF